MNADPTEFCEEAGERTGPPPAPGGDRPREKAHPRGLGDGRGWRTPLRSDENQGGCVEAAPAPGGVRLRDSRHRKGSELFFGRGEWAAFLAALGAKRGERAG
ncbi:DUF397 domain-containing protein [Nocardiopsis composta]|uniref:DUF397 domain-containing protein n=1 Tax=Nocardiopsis composta TaxID=157465 RepID=A0A7W8QSK6_9ACTN|nr:DUF397 domain-containing protein [Nocardiopsis composta]MBB5435817.1 hypothetical protein [Nocardiopsis composta]